MDGWSSDDNAGRRDNANHRASQPERAVITQHNTMHSNKLDVMCCEELVPLTRRELKKHRQAGRQADITTTTSSFAIRSHAQYTTHNT